MQSQKGNSEGCAHGRLRARPGTLGPSPGPSLHRGFPPFLVEALPVPSVSPLLAITHRMNFPLASDGMQWEADKSVCAEGLRAPVCVC